MSKKKTHAEYVEELAKVNPDIEVLGIYCGASIKIPHRCKKDGYVWDLSPLNALSGKGCPKCGGVIKKTHEEYVAELLIKNPTVEVVEKYITAKTKIMHHCLIHDVYWKTEPSLALSGHGCSECKNERISASKYKSHEEYVEKLKQKNPTIQVIDKYIDCRTPIKHRCLVDDYEWNIAPSNALDGKGCPQCARKRLSELHAKTHEEYLNELFKKSPHINVVDKYIDSHTKITHYCLTHNVYYDIAPTNALYGYGCPECVSEINHQKNLKTHEQYVNEAKVINPNIEVIGKYININTSIMHRCIIHNFEWETTPASILQGCGCPTCKIEKIRKAKSKTHEQYVEEVKNINPNIQVLGTYINAKTPILHKCLIDNFEWNTVPESILQGCGCPKCNESKGERRIRIWLEKNNIDYIHQHKYEDCKDIYPLPFDFYIPTYNVLIEYDGEQHFRPIDLFGGQEYFEYIQKHDTIKNEYCENNGISLLRIPYYKFNNIEEELNNFLFI